MGFQRRQYLRARLHEQVLYVSDDFVFCTDIYNISEGGILLKGLSNIPSVKAVSLVVPVFELPEFSLMAPDVLMTLNRGSFRIKVFRTRAKIVRTLDELSDFHSVLTTKIGCEFVDLSTSSKNLINKYVEHYAKNLVFFLGQFEKGNHGQEQVKYLRKIAELLGYDQSAPITEIRFSALHDYQSLEE